jgi:hypothetical protein
VYKRQAHWHTLTAEKAKEIVAINKQGKKIAQLEDFIEEVSTVNVEKKFENVVGQDSLTRFDQPKRKQNNNNKRKKKPFKKNEQ